MATDDPFWNWLREDAKLFQQRPWEFQRFRSSKAIFSKGGTLARAYNGEPYDPNQWEVREGAWDHEHCRFCNACICDSTTDHLDAGYTGGVEWLCPTCYQRVIVEHEDPEDVLREAGWE